MAHLRLALRTLFRTPFLTMVAILSLALGIGANSAIFSLYEQMLLRPLPVRDPAALVNLLAPGVKSGSMSSDQTGDSDAIFSYAMFRDLERVQTSFTGIAGHRSFGANLSFKGQTDSGSGALVSGSYFDVLGLTPALGRLFGPDDDRSPGGHPLVVLAHDYWRTRFGQSPAILNEPLIVNGQAMTIVGVAPAGFAGTTLGSRPDVFVPLTMRAKMVPGWSGFENRRNYWVYLFARLKPGVTLEQAQAGINGPYRSIVTQVEAPLQDGMSPATLARFKTKTIGLEPGRTGQSSLHENARMPLTLLLGVTGFVLLIACANVANLLLARGAGRASEMAVRLALGASRRQVMGQLLLESVLLALMGGVLGLIVARWTLDGMVAMAPEEEMGMVAFSLEPSIVAFTALLSLGTGLLFGLLPALHSSRPDLVTVLKNQSGQPSGARDAARLRTTLATAQIALSMALLILAGLFTRSLMNVSRVDLGLRVDNLVSFGLSPELNGYTPQQSRLLFERGEEALAALPGVTGVAASTVPLLSGSNWGSNVTVQGFDAGPDADTNAMFNQIGPGYFRTLGIPLIAGREFTRQDAAGAPKVVIVNEAFARKFRLGRDAVGRRMNTGGGNNVKLEMEIVGLVQDAKYSEVKREIPPQFFLPYRQDDQLGAITFYVRTSLPPDQLVTTLPRVVKGLDANLPIESLRTLSEQIRRNTFADRMITTMSAAFAALATLLAAIGLYGVLAYTVAQRTREIGLRMALGADASRVRRMVLGQVGRMTLVGAVIGIGTAMGLAHAGRSLLFELTGYDPVVLATATIVLTLVALGAGLLPAIRASRVAPMQALRYE